MSVKYERIISAKYTKKLNKYRREQQKIAIFDTSKRAGKKRPREYEAPQREYECGRVFSRTLTSVETSFLARVGVLYGQHALSVTERGGRTGAVRISDKKYGAVRFSDKLYFVVYLYRS